MEGESPDLELKIGILEFPLPASGLLLLCTDGLWNYAPETERIGALLHGPSQTEDCLLAARRLVVFANEQGGRDNISAAIYRA